MMSLGLMEGGEGLQQSIQEDITAGGLWLDLTSDESLTGEDLGVLGEMLNSEEGCGEQDPFCQFQRAIEIAYDYRNQMVQYADLDNLRTHRYHYDCFGRRGAKVTDHQSGGGLVTRFVYGGQASWQVLAEYETFQPASGVPAIASYVFGNYIDEPIQARRDFDAGGSTYANQDFYYHADELFSIVAITAGQANTTVRGQSGSFNAGAVIERVRYGDYGNPTVMDASGSTLGDESTLGNRFAFTGREHDGETRFSYYRTRYLEHAWGRFTTRDTIGTWGDHANSGNGSTYVRSAPAILADPFGLVRMEVRFAPLSVGHHAYLVLICPQGVYYFRGGPSDGRSGSSQPSQVTTCDGAGSCGGGSSPASSNSTSPGCGDPGLGNPSTNKGPWGPIDTEFGRYGPNTIDWDPESDDPGAIVLDDPSMSCDEAIQRLRAISHKMNSQFTPYNPLGPNSNSTVRKALEEFGITPPTSDHLPVSVPGWNTDIPGIGTPPRMYFPTIRPEQLWY